MSLRQLNPLLIFSFIFFACGTMKRSASHYHSGYPSFVEVNSACKASIAAQWKDDPATKKLLVENNENSLELSKIHTVKNEKKALYRLSSAKLIVTENCSGKEGNEIRLSHVIELENIQSHEIKSFRTDTMPVKEKKFNQPVSLSQTKPDLNRYLSALTRLNFEKVESYLLQSKTK